MRFSLRYVLCKWFVQTVNLIFVISLLIDCAFVEAQMLFVMRLLYCCHLEFQFS
jgi:hypothetical protein